jgi:hypothetical protein
MTLRLPRTPIANVKVNKPVDALDYEIAQEMAGALGRPAARWNGLCRFWLISTPRGRSLKR